jgi:16S rRNA (uracil1498-N3)-methyltransferase
MGRSERFDESWLHHPEAASGLQVTMGSSESQHLHRVLRLSSGTSVTVTDGVGSVFDGILSLSDPRACRVDVGTLVATQPRPRLSMAQVLLKARAVEDVFDLCAQTPLRAFQPLWSEHCQLPRSSDMDGQLERLRRKASAAICQSKQAWCCEILPPAEFGQFLSNLPEGGTLWMCDATGSEAPQPKVPGWIAIGPEGGFSPRELDLARERGAALLSLGPTRLRAVAAGLYALGRLGA